MKVPSSHNGNQTASCHYWWICATSTQSLQTTTSRTIILSAPAQMQHNTAGKKLFCKLDYSQAYYCLEMARQRSVELLAFNFASRAYVYRRLAQGHTRALSAFSSFIREFLDTVIEADQCVQYLDGIGISANTTEQLIKNIRAVFKFIREAGLKLAI